jgi:hypothetical protein
LFKFYGTRVVKRKERVKLLEVRSERQAGTVILSLGFSSIQANGGAARKPSTPLFPMRDAALVDHMLLPIPVKSDGGGGSE